MASSQNAGAMDHKGVLRGRCTLCSCVTYKEAKGSNKCAGCFCPSSVHEAKSGCIGSAACQCTQFIKVPGTNDCYHCGHFATDHRNLGRISVEGPSHRPSVQARTSDNAGVGEEQKALKFSEMLQANKMKRKMATGISGFGTAKKGKAASRDPNIPTVRKTIKIQLKRPKYMQKGVKRTFVDVDEQKQVRFGKPCTLENVLKACALEFLGIEENQYDEEIARRNLDVFLLDGRARVTDPSFPYNKTSFNFTYLKPSDLSYGNISETSEQSLHDSTKQRSEIYVSGRSDEPNPISLPKSNPESSNNSIEEVADLSKEKLLQAGKSIYPTTADDSREIFYKVLTFDVTTETWQSLGHLIVERASEKPFSSGGMREAYWAKLAIANKNPLLSSFQVGDDIVVKEYTTSVKEQALAKGKSLRKMAMKEVQTQMVVSHLAKQFKKTTRGILEEVPEVIHSFILQKNESDEEVFTMEEALHGNFTKYLINDGNATKHGVDTSNGHVCLAFAHWTLEYTNESLVVTDLQGVKLRLTDVEVATAEKGYFGIGNLGTDAIETFKGKHACNDICRRLGLKDLKGEADVPKSKFTF